MIKRKILASLESEMTSGKVIVLTGMRRVGKTTLAKYLYDQIIDKRKLFLDLENPLNQRYFQQVDYEKVKTLLDQLASGRSEELIVFLDEVQNVKNLPSVVKYLSDHYQIKFILTGSASFYLKNLFTESLAGRKRLFELYPLTFEEFISYKAPQLSKPQITDKVNEPTFQLFSTHFYEYLTYGGFPSVVTQTTHTAKLAELADIYTSYFQKEVQLLSDFKKLDIVRSVMTLLIQRVGSKLDVSKIASELGVSRITIQEYLDFLEGTYFLRRIGAYSKKIDVRVRTQKKPYICDNGILSMVNVPAGALLENCVFQLLRNRGSVYYYQSKSGAEMDFILKTNHELVGMEVKSQVHQTYVRRVSNVAKRLGLTNFYLVSQNYSPFEHVIYPFQL